jgi:hypothetical protein
MLVRRFSKYFSYTHEKLVTTCKELSSLPDSQLSSYFLKQETMKQFFESVPRSARSMQTSDINEMLKHLSKFKSIDSISPAFWKSISEELVKRNKDYELEDIVKTVEVFSTVKTQDPAVKNVLKVLSKEVEETDWEELKTLKLNELESLLASYTLKNVGSAMFFHVISETLLYHKDLPTLKYQHLARLAYYFSRTPTSKERAAKFIRFVEEKLWNGIHHGKLNEMEQITGVINYVIPGNIGSNDLRALLEFTLFRFLTEPKNQITISRLCQVTTAFTHYIIAYKPLDLLLKQLVRDSLDNMNVKEIIQVLWAYCRHNKAEEQFVSDLVVKVMEKLRNEEDGKDISIVPFRHFSYFINSIVNSGIRVQGVEEFIDSVACRCIETQGIQDHYLVKGLSLINQGEFLSKAIQELSSPSRLPPSHPQDLSIAILSTFERPYLQSDSFLSSLISKALKSSNHMKPGDISRIVYSLSRLNRGDPKLFDLLSTQILKSDLSRLPPVQLGMACLGFGIQAQEDFCLKVLPSINDIFHKYQKIEYEDYSDTDEEDFTSNKLVLLNTEDLEFTSDLPASAVVQLAWLVASVGVKDREFWNEKLLNKLRSVQLSQKPYLLNPWVWTARTLQDEEEFVTAVDNFHFALLGQVMNLVTSEYKEGKFNFVQNSKEFLEDVLSTLNKAKADVEIIDNRLVANGKKVLLYENEHYCFKSPGFMSQNSHQGLLGPVKVERMVLEAKNIPYFEIFRGKWVGSSTRERLELVKRLIKDNN